MALLILNSYPLSSELLVSGLASRPIFSLISGTLIWCAGWAWGLACLTQEWGLGGRMLNSRPNSQSLLHHFTLPLLTFSTLMFTSHELGHVDGPTPHTQLWVLPRDQDRVPLTARLLVWQNLCKHFQHCLCCLTQSPPPYFSPAISLGAWFSFWWSTFLHQESAAPLLGLGVGGVQEFQTRGYIGGDELLSRLFHTIALAITTAAVVSPPVLTW